jgi:formate--tetrahydrofolate ligase
LPINYYHITESGFGADIGFEKFWNLKCRFSGLKPDCSVIVTTVRAMKMHGGGPKVVPGKPLEKAYIEQNTALVEKGVENLIAHIEIVKLSGIPAVVCINHFYNDTDEEIAIIRKASEAAGARVAVSRHWEFGGEGAMELAQMVVEAAEEAHEMKFLYEEDLPLRDKILRIATGVYGADGVSFTTEVEEKIRKIEEDPELKKLGPCMAKTHLSLSHDPGIKGRPKGWTLPIKDVLLFRGAGFIVPVAGDIKLMPGTAGNR